MKRTSIAIGLAAGLLVAGFAAAQPYGMGPGMMGGYGYGPSADYGMGPGMMGGARGAAYAGLDLTAEQRQKIAEIEQATAKTQWQLMGTMHELGYSMHENSGATAFDEAAARKSFDAMTAARKAMFEMQIDARKKIDALLTPRQREQLRRY